MVMGVKSMVDGGAHPFPELPSAMIFGPNLPPPKFSKPALFPLCLGQHSLPLCLLFPYGD